MKLTISSEIGLDCPNVTSAYVTWLDVAVEEDGRKVGKARVALVHVGEIADAQGDLWPILKKTNLDAIHDLYFAQGWYRDEFADGAGIDLLFIEAIEIDQDFADKNLDMAIVRRLCDTFGSGCQLAVMPYRGALHAADWGRLGFAISTPGRTVGHMHMKLGYRHARVVDASGSGDFQVLPTDGSAALCKAQN